jgi:hypothetical protein
MWIIILVLLLIAAHLNLTGLVPLQPGDPTPPWWVGGRLVWPFAVETRTLIPAGDLLNTLTPLLSVAAAAFFLAAAAALLRWYVPVNWFPWLVIAGAVASLVLQVTWISGWAAFPILLNVLLLWAVFGQNLTAATLRG